MTPSEIADWLSEQGRRHRPNSDKLVLAAAMIRELDSSARARADIILAQAKSEIIDRENLKIATEALKSAQFSLDALDNIPAEVCVMNAKLAFQVITQALDRIKETK